MQRLMALYRDPVQARSAQIALEGAGFSQIGVADPRTARALVPRVRSAAPEGALLGAFTGAAGGAFAAIIGFLIPEMLFGVDGLVHVLRAGAIVGAIIGFEVGFALGLATPEPQASLYAKAAMRDGMILWLDVDDLDDARRAKKILKRTRGIELLSESERVGSQRPFGARPLTS